MIPQRLVCTQQNNNNVIPTKYPTAKHLKTFAMNSKFSFKVRKLNFERNKISIFLHRKTIYTRGISFFFMLYSHSYFRY